ncbi:hypothetical protein [Candidatus Nitrosotenuis cloacae]|uniref:hypothetical protein n=1 Tax=Candidatus Nitrosotenuis cloacae TaxID=1603555 RepID=UPI00069B8D4B|nr:hypothetical protein [Candidatus Nitrosotenuis cloacae]
MKNASFYILAILVFGLMGNPLSQHALNYQDKTNDNLNVLGVNAFAESDDDEQDSEILDNEQGNESEDETEDESEDETEDESEDETEDESEDETEDESEDETEDEEGTEDNKDDESDTDNNGQDRQKSEAKTEQIISKLEQKIEQLEQRIQSLLEKVQNGKYFGNLENTDQTTKSYTMSFDGTATSIQDQGVSAPVSADIFVETLVTKDGYSKLRVTGGQVDIGQTTYDIVFGKARVTDNSSDQGSFILLVAEVMDDNGDITTIRMNLDSAQSFQMADTQPIDLQIGSPQSKIAGQWFLEGTGSLSS